MTHPTPEQLDSAAWIKSSYSGGGGNECVEIAHGDTWIGVRDSKNPAGPALVLSPTTFTALLTTIRTT
ncbi:DUF397 domain-containing protein [Streptomyces sp. TR02-1]|uniref:DUF397 domain-containing protein n=1 Tax=Streptomyces sp. TR02-1 TaxID=3385977 RepID=UPI0039A1FC55